MNEDLSQALLILVVGMFTVFLILGLVVLTGRLLIQMVNRFAPVAVVKSSPQRKKSQVSSSPSTTSQLSPPALAAIVAAVQHLTDGKGRIEKIEEIDPPK